MQTQKCHGIIKVKTPRGKVTSSEDGYGGAWLAQSVEWTTLDLLVTRSSPMLGVEIIK